MPDPLDALAARAAEDSFFLAWLLAAYAHSEGLDDAGLAAALGCQIQELAMLRLCRVPAADPEESRDDVSCIAERFGLDHQRLAEVIQRGRVVRRFQQADPRVGGSLMAARDREDEPPPELPKEGP
jgi:hypothetical protein